MRKLTVKNFSVIKKAELEFGKITVLIGPQSSGKSLLCKLAYFLGGEIIGIAVESLLNRNDWDDFRQAGLSEFRERFSTNGWLRTNSIASYSSRQFTVEAAGVGDPTGPEVELRFSPEFERQYRLNYENEAKQVLGRGITRNDLRVDLWVKFSLLLDHFLTEESIYIPSARSFFTAPSRAVASLQNPEIDHTTRQFAGLIAWDTKWKIGLLTSGRRILQGIENEMQRIAGGIVSVSSGELSFLAFDGRNLPLRMLSSGTLELLPLFNVVTRLAFEQEHRNALASSKNIPEIADISYHRPLIYLEEPEAHVFPSTQYELVRLFAQLSGDPELNFSWIITTHSPYTLSSFNNLIYSGQLASEKPELKDAIARMVPERYWIEPGTFAAYSVHDGKTQSILSESGLIDGEYLDSISEKIGNEFDSLLRLEYDKTKAS